jgi:hypothetical protein
MQNDVELRPHAILLKNDIPSLKLLKHQNLAESGMRFVRVRQGLSYLFKEVDVEC